MNVCTTDRLTGCVRVLVYCIDPESEESSTYTDVLFGRNIIDDAA